MLTSAGAVPNPTVTGPIPANAPPGDPSHDYPFFSFAPQLAALKGPHNYVEEEFFFEGTANRYTIPTGVLRPRHRRHPGQRASLQDAHDRAPPGAAA